MIIPGPTPIGKATVLDELGNDIHEGWRAEEKNKEEQSIELTSPGLTPIREAGSWVLKFIGDGGRRKRMEKSEVVTLQALD